MKSVHFLFYSLLLVVLGTGYGASDSNPDPIPFTAEFSTTGGIQINMSAEEVAGFCGEGPFGYNIQEGTGTATELGTITYYATFCVDLSTFESGEIEFFSTDNTEAYVVAENGDTLFLPSQEGVITATDEEGYNLEFSGDMTITEGTGRYQKIRLEVSTLGLVVMQPERTDHTWTGTLEF